MVLLIFSFKSSSREMGAVLDDGREHFDAAELLQAQSGLWNHVFNHVGSMSLKCAVELGVPDAIHQHGGTITLSDLSVALAIPPSKTANLRRVMRVLTNSGIFSSDGTDAGDEITYHLTPLSRLLVRKGAVAAGLSPFVLAMLDPIVTTPYHYMAAWFRGDSPSAFAEAHGCGFWDKANEQPAFNKTFNDGMASDATFLAGLLVKECAGVFKGLRSLVDVGGGTGSAAKAIAEAFPQVQCSVLDLPQVIDTVTEKGAVSFIPGDMFEHVPSADAVLLKWILHDWGDEDCVRILKKCKEAIPSREEGGKVIIIDLVVGSKNSHVKAMETQLHWDIKMMVYFDAIERDEEEWRKIFAGAGFTDYKIVRELGLRSIIELYP